MGVIALLCVVVLTIWWQTRIFSKGITTSENLDKGSKQKLDLLQTQLQEIKMENDKLKHDNMKLLSQGKANHVPAAEEHDIKTNNDMCVFILATPGSGSSTMVDLVGTC